MTETATETEVNARTGEILDRIKGIFAQKGFDGASMQDLARAAGMSAGNFYRYFPSKNAIIGALVQRDLDRMAEDFARILAAPDPRAAVQQAVPLMVHPSPNHCENDGLQKSRYFKSAFLCCRDAQILLSDKQD